MSDDRSLERIRVVATYYRGADWQLMYDSSNGGSWSFKLVPAPPGQEEAAPRDVVERILRQQEAGEPVFAMRCEALEIIAEALEHWHARVILRTPTQQEADEDSS